MDGSLVLSLSESGPGLATTRMGRCALLRGATDLVSSAIERRRARGDESSQGEVSDF